MAAVQQCSPADASESPQKRTAFIESMEEEMRRCAEHLEQRRQSRRRSHRTSWDSQRRANGFVETEGSGPEAGASRKRRGNTLPRSFTLSTDGPESHDGWQQRHGNFRQHSTTQQPSPTATRERGARYTRALSYEREMREDRDRTPLSSYSRGSSAPPEPYTVYVNSRGNYSPGSTSSSSGRVSSSHSPTNRGLNHSSRSPRSSPRSSASPPPVAPKPARSRAYSKRNTGGRRLWSEGTDSREASPQVEDVSTGPVFPSAEVSQSELDVFLEPVPPPPATTQLGGADDQLVVEQAAVVLEQNQDGSTAQPSTNQQQCTQEPTVNDSTMEQPLDQRSETTITDTEERGTAVEGEKSPPAPSTEEQTPSDPIEDSAPSDPAPAEEQSVTEEKDNSEVKGDSEVANTAYAEREMSNINENNVESAPSQLPVEQPHVGAPLKDDKQPVEEQEQPSVTEGEREQSPVEQPASPSEPDVTDQPVQLSEQEESVADAAAEDGTPGTADEEDKTSQLRESAQVSEETVNRAPSSSSEKSYLESLTGHSRMEGKPTSGDSDTNNKMMQGRPESGVLNGCEVTAPEVKSIPVRSVKHTRSHKQQHHNESRDSTGSKQPTTTTRRERGKSEPPPTVSENKIHITVSSSVLAAPSASESVSTLQRQSQEELALLVKELQIKLREKDEDLARGKRQHEREIKEKDDQIRKLSKENKKVEREKWELLKRARDAAERSLHLRTQLDMKEASFRTSQSENTRIRDELMSVKSANTSLRALLSDLRAPKASVDQAVQVELHGSLRRNRSIELAFTQGELSQEMDSVTLDRSSELRMSTSSLPWPDRWEEGGDGDSSSLYDDSRETTPVPGGLRLSAHSLSAPDGGKKSKKKRTAIFGRMLRSSGRKRGSVTSMDGLDLRQSSLIHGPSRGGPTPLGYPYQPVPPDLKEQWRVLEEFQSVPFNQWTLSAIVAWMEAGIGMSQYTASVREKVSSGNSLLGFTEQDLEKKLGIHNPLHRRKLRLAIQDQRSPHTCQYPHASRIDASWVSHEWVQDCGLPHLSEALLANLVDGRVLNSLSKDDIRRYLKVSKKTDQISFLSGVELLRMHDFNREAIQQHRQGSQNPFYWTNRDVCDWLKDINLEAYANNVIGGGVHGALLFLERGRFSAEHLASILKIPMSKTQHRRLLAEKLATLFTEDFNDSLDHQPPPQMSSSPLHLSPHSQGGSPSPERRYHSPLHISSSYSPVIGPDRHKSPPNDCPHPARKNSLTSIRTRTTSLTRFAALTQPDPAPPPAFQRTGSQPSVHLNSTSSPVHRNQLSISAAELARRSLRESALRSVSSTHRDNGLQPIRRSVTPTVLSTVSSSTTV